MKLSILDMPPATLDDNFNLYKEALEGGTRFGVGSAHEKPKDHPVMDQDWNVTRITREKRDLARSQLGTSGSGNHFVESGLLTLTTGEDGLGLDAGQYVAILSHSGSRGTGAAGTVCSSTRGSPPTRTSPGSSTTRPLGPCHVVPAGHCAKSPEPRSSGTEAAAPKQRHPDSTKN
jgi:hypothetical protein